MMKKILLFLIGIYRKYLSGLKARPSCRFTPTCSEYAYGAIREWGGIVGLALSVFRLLRCNPLFRGGVDRVPLSGAKRHAPEGYTVFYARSPYGKYCVNSFEDRRKRK